MNAEYKGKLARIARTIQLLSHTVHGYTITELHRRLVEDGFEVSTRTVDRDIKQVLSAAGVGLSEVQRKSPRYYSMTSTAYRIEGNAPDTKNMMYAEILRLSAELDKALGLIERQRREIYLHKQRHYNLKERRATA